MALVLPDVSFFGPAMPGPFVLHRLESLLLKKKLLDRESKATKKELQERWEPYYRKLRAMGEQGGEQRVLHHVIEPLVERLGYETIVPSEKVATREGPESGGYLLRGPEGTPHLRVWVVSAQTDLDAPNKRGRAYRFSPALVAQRVLLKQGEKIGLLTDGIELRIVLSDPSGRDSHLRIELGRSGGWRASRQVPDSYRLLRALCSPKGVPELGELLDEARLAQTGVTRTLRDQARHAVERFIQGLLDDPANRQARAEWGDLDETAKQLWHEGLIFVYRLLFILKLETAPDPARSFSFATMSTWKNSFSPSTALAPIVEEVRDKGIDTGGFLSESLRALFRLFAEGVSSSDLQVSRLGGMLFGPEETPLLDRLTWSDKAVADLLDALLWTNPDQKGRGKKKGEQVLGRERIHYGTLDVEDLGRVYEALLELEPGVTYEPMCRLRRAKLEVVVPLAQGAAFKKNTAEDGAEGEAEADEDGEGKKTKVVYVEEIPANRFFLRVGLGRKASGSYYTPHAFVRFLVQETLGPQLAERSPKNDPNPGAILALNVLDPAMGSGHFLVEVCRYLGEALYEACRLCDEQALEAQRKADTTKRPEARAELLERARVLWQRVEDLPDPKDELVAYLPSRILDADESGLSQRKALALCRRLVAVHCLYGVDKNPLAVELARVSLWLESYAEGLPLTFLQHRLVVGDSLTGPFFEHLLTFPGTGQSAEQLHSRVEARLTQILADALAHVRSLEASIGKDVADLELKRVAKQKLDEALAPLRRLAEVWTGGVMLEQESDDAGYEDLLGTIARDEPSDAVIEGRPGLQRMARLGHESVPYDLVFPEVFHPDGTPLRTGGFDAVVGNPPWDAVQPKAKEFYATFDLRILDAPTKRERLDIEIRVSRTPEVEHQWNEYQREVEAKRSIYGRLCKRLNEVASGEASGATLDVWQPFAERAVYWLKLGGRAGLVLPSAFHANQSATGIRDLWLHHSKFICCYSFENRTRLFEIHRSFKFAPVVVEASQETTMSFRCGFYLQKEDWLEGRQGELVYTREFLEHASGEDLTFPELRSAFDVSVVSRCMSSGVRFGAWVASLATRLGRELHMTDDAYRFTDVGNITISDPRDPLSAAALLERGYVPLHEGKTFHQFDDRWEDRPRYIIALATVADKPTWTGAARFYRAAFRDIASSTNERTSIFCLLPPGVLVGNTAPVERGPELRANACALQLIALGNTYVFDWNVRQKGASHVNLFLLNACPVPKLKPQHNAFLAHATLRLVCNHAGYEPLWTEQLGAEWREPTSKHTWPVLAGDVARWLVRAAIDAVIADAYGLDRSQYEHVLRSFSHASYPNAPTLCLEAFDELKSIGLPAFTKKHNPYWDIPLVTELPQPVLDLPAASEPATDTFALAAPAAKPTRKKRSKRA